ncbi:BAR adaptor protein Hob1 [Malassezia caprae]|uniref:BAR adaptor protein Hob1 n=1 Tax=Malassezia caprae TaxID=1381934 RepID=A0AAF0IX64_9BASI|nr:BAR adaptor protein Hob1 [Malassezia caprae]
MKGFTKFIQRTPHVVTSKVGLSSKSTDVEFDHLRHKFKAVEKLIRQLTRESRTYLDAIKKMLESCSMFTSEFSTLYHPLGMEYDLERRHPEVVQTLVNLTGYMTYIDDLRESLRPELELIATRVIAPAEELESLLKNVEKAITKRDHKLIDFDRHSNSYTKLKEKQNRSAKDDQNMFKLEHESESAAADYEHHNNLLKDELPKFLDMVTRLITPLLYSFYYMQLNVFYLSMEKLKQFSSGKFDLSENNLISHEHKYAMDMSQIIAELESFSIQKPVPPSARILQMAKSGTSLSTRSKSQMVTGSEKAAMPASSFPPAAPAAGDPPAYTASAPATAVPPAPTPAAADYVIALYDYAATADGDLSFQAGDKIEVLKRTASAEDWWTGRLNGIEGVFPGNYVREA